MKTNIFFFNHNIYIYIYIFICRIEVSLSIKVARLGLFKYNQALKQRFDTHGVIHPSSQMISVVVMND